MTELKLTYTDQGHIYYLNGVKAKSVTAVAKIVTDGWAIQKWHERMIAIGTAIDPNIRENIATHLEDRFKLNDICEDAKKVAKAHEAADRGTQMHRVLELVLLDQEAKLLTDQQRRDAEVLKRTLDRYRLTPFDQLAEQFVAWPDYNVTGRFDAILEKPDNTPILIDLKSGPNAVAYPQSTAAQLALYARAPHISDHVHTRAGKQTVTDWRKMPDRLDLARGYVLLVEPDAEVGTLHEIDINHGWAAAQWALQIVNWRKEYNYGKGIAHEVELDSATEFIARIGDTPTLEDLRSLWKRAAEKGVLTPIFKVEAEKRSRKLQRKEGAA